MEYRNTKKMKDTENKTETLSSNLHQASSKFYAEFLSATKIIKPTVESRYKAINDTILMAQPYVPIFLNEYCPSDFRRSLDFIHELKVKVDCQRYSYTGGPAHLHWIWRTSVDENKSETLQNYTKLAAELQKNIPVYHSRSVKGNFTSLYGRCTGAKPAILRSIFRSLTGDQSAPHDLTTAEVDDRVNEMLESEDSDLIWDLRIGNHGRPE